MTVENLLSPSAIPFVRAIAPFYIIYEVSNPYVRSMT